MSARGLLANPALFLGIRPDTTGGCRAVSPRGDVVGLHTGLIQRHLAYMLEGSFQSRAEAIHFNSR